MTAEKPKPFTFFIRGLQMTTVVERMFHVDSAAERAGWLEAIERVKKKLDEVRLATTFIKAGSLSLSCFRILSVPV